MKKTEVFLKVMVAFLLVLSIGYNKFARAGESGTGPAPGKERLAVLWTSGDPDVAHKVCFMYTHAAKKQGWFDEVVLIVWGPSSRLLAGDKNLQAKVRAMIADGVIVQACVVCADLYGVSEKLREIGIDVKGMGKPLSDYLKGGWKVLTF